MSVGQKRHRSNFIKSNTLLGKNIFNTSYQKTDVVFHTLSYKEMGGLVPTYILLYRGSTQLWGKNRLFVTQTDECNLFYVSAILTAMNFVLK